ncbi:MAG: hypothetical protein IJU25_08490, partial [Lachnospiraceae bacterium]|nr:hypothetical protein [Lachnospiraceae bacterium]
YLIMIILWAVTIRRRIVDDAIRHRILTACIFMVILFFLRMCKYSYFPEDVYVMEYLWYSYSIPLTVIPLCMFMAALHVEPVENEKAVRITEKILILINAALIVILMTNQYHGLVYAIAVHPDKEYTHGLFYYVLLGWRTLLSLGTLYIFFRKCSLTAARKKWYLPAICIALSCVLLTWYLLIGGSPKIGTHKLFQLHEALCIPYIMAFESIIQIGMVRANSAYERLFDHSGINACIYDRDIIPCRTTKNWVPNAEDGDHRFCMEPISGGFVTWVEDISAINRLNREIEEVTEELKDKNDLISKENEVRAERVSYETKNRLYNRIATAVRTHAIRVNELLDAAANSDDENTERDHIIYAAALSAYIKRMGNLMLLTDGSKTLSSEELKLAIGESMDYLRLKGCVCDFSANGQCQLSSGIALLAYELFESAVEDVWLRLGAVSVSLENTNAFAIDIALDTPAEAVSSAWKDREILQAGGRLSVRYEDETYYIRLEAKV